MNNIVIVTDSDVHHNNFGVQYVEDLHQNTEIYHTTEQKEVEFVRDDFDVSLDIVVLPTGKTK